jgi:subtilisin family serine protease
MHRFSDNHRRPTFGAARRQLLQGIESLEPRRVLAAAVTYTASPAGDYYHDAVLVRFQPNTPEPTIQSLVSSVNGTIATRHTGALSGLMEVKLAAANQNSAGVQNALAKLSQSTSVKYAEPNLRRTFEAVPNDPRFGELWGLHNTGQGGGVADADIDAPEAWDMTRGSSNVVVAVLDTGIDASHPDLVGNLWNNPGEVPGDGIDNDNNGYIDDTYGWDMFDDDAVPQDDVAHGTHVAGTIGAVGDNSVGITGVNWDVSLMVLKIGDATGIPSASIISAIQYVTTMKQNGINVVVSNNSYGGYGFSQAEQDAIAANNAAGVLFVAAAGNDAIDNDVLPAYPASYNVANILAVAATDRGDSLAYFSNRGVNNVDLGAPGVEILSTVPAFEDPSGYAFFDGTSMASPHVAGAVALLASAGGSISHLEMKNYILAGVDPLPSLSGQVATGGRLNINNTLALIPRSFVQGRVFTDKLGDGILQANDTILSGIHVYHDANNNGLPDSNEASAFTDVNGFYNLGPLTSRFGAATIRVSPPPFYDVTIPRSGAYFVTFAFNGEVRSDVNFGLYGLPGEIHGHKWLDHNSNASLNPEHGDGPMAGVFVFVDIDNDGRAGIGEPAAVTAADGSFVIKNVPVGTYALREVLTPGYGTAFPQTNNGAHIFTMTPRAVLTGYDFFNSPAHDYGDAPNSYQTTLASGGPVHGYKAGFQLGANLDADADGNPTGAGLGDDNTFIDDEDGIRFLNFPAPGGVARIQADVRVPAFTQPGYLHGWMDFNADGDFSDPGEKIVQGARLGTGVYTFNVNVPATAPLGFTFARFRYGTEANLGSGGRSLAGEVEDHRIQVLPTAPIAVDDGDEPPLDPLTADIMVREGSQKVRLDVLANDIRSTRGTLYIVRAPFAGAGLRTALGGTVNINGNGTPNNPKDDYLVYTAAPPPADSEGQTHYVDSFTYSATDGFAQDSATVWITVQKLSTAPTPVEDISDAPPNTAATSNSRIIDVLANDVRGKISGVAQTRVALVSFDTQVFENGVLMGTVARDTRGTPNNWTDDRLIFTATPAATDQTVQFSYTINNPGDLDKSLRRTSSVTVQVRPDPNGADASDDVEMSLRVFNVDPASGGRGTRVDSGVAPYSLVEGGEYWVGVYGRDLRPPVVVGESGEGNGALAVYLDLLYDARYVDVVRVPTTQNPLGMAIDFVAPYDAGSPEGAATTAGLIDEVGNFTLQQVGDGFNAVFFVRFRVKDVPNAQLPANIPLWRTAPADRRSDVGTGQDFDNDIYVNDENNPATIRNVPIDDIAYLRSENFAILPTVATPLRKATSVAPVTTAPTPTSTATPVKTVAPTSTATSGPSNDELLAARGNVSPGSASTPPRSTTSQATDQAILALFGSELFASGKKK